MRTKGWLAAVILSLPVAGSTEELFSVQGARPLSEAVTVLERQYGWRISYEDPPYTDPADLVDHTDPSYRGPWRAIDPRGGPLEIPYSISKLTGRPTESPERLLQMLIDDHASRGYPGRFQVSVIGDLYFVRPAEGSALDTPITIPTRRRTLLAALNAVLQAVSDATGMPVKPGAGLLQSGSDPFSFGASGEPARDVLLRLFKTQKGYWFGWQMLYAPERGGYFFSIHGDRVAAEPEPRKPEVTRGAVNGPDGSRAVPQVPIP
jgi:hypothetical protein